LILEQRPKLNYHRLRATDATGRGGGQDGGINKSESDEAAVCGEVAAGARATIEIRNRFGGDRRGRRAVYPVRIDRLSAMPTGSP
jgi:hypothetical protein